MSLAVQDIKLTHAATTGRKIFSRLQIIVSSLLQPNASCVSARLCRSQVLDKSPDCRTFLCSHRTQQILEQQQRPVQYVSAPSFRQCVDGRPL